MRKLTRSSLNGVLNRALFAYENGCFASRFLLLGIGFLEASKKANLSFKSPSSEPLLNRTGSVPKRSVPKTLAFAFGSRLRSKTRRSKTRVLGRRLRNGKPQDRLRFRDLCGKTLAFNKHIAIISCVLEASLGARACVQVLCIQKRGVLRLRSQAH